MEFNGVYICGWTFAWLGDRYSKHGILKWEDAENYSERHHVIERKIIGVVY